MTQSPKIHLHVVVCLQIKVATYPDQMGFLWASMVLLSF